MTFPSDDEELIRHAQSLGGLARSLVGPEDADDLLQDVTLQALHASSEPPQSWRAWLATVLRNRAGKRRLADQRRELRERHTQSERSASIAPSALTAAMHRETIQRLDAALLSLPQPYQDTLLLRYFEGLTPTEIAMRSGESLSTIKSRLQRGLALLRGSLGKDGRDGDWRASLVLAFGLGGSKPVAVGTSVVLLGMLAMTWKLLLGALVAAVLMLWWWPDAVVTPTADATAKERVAAASAVVTDKAVPATRIEVTADSSALLSVEQQDADRAVTFVGRCVNEDGEPLAGVAVRAEVRVRGGSDRLDTTNGNTGSDGTFVIAVASGCEHSIELNFESPGRCRCVGSFEDRQAGESVDLGDLLLPLQCVLRGRIVDEAGVPQPGVRVYFHKDRSNEVVSPSPPAAGRRPQVGADGTFVLQADRALSPGTYIFMLRDRKLLNPDARMLVVAVGNTEKSIELVIGPEPERCRGVVVDSAGIAIEHATASLGDNSCETTSDGRFAVLPDPNQPRTSYPVHVRKPGYRNASMTWNGKADAELRFVLTPEPGMLICVVDDVSSKPVEEFAVWLVSNDDWPWQPAVKMSKHDGGIAHVHVTNGEYSVAIETPSQPSYVSQLLPVLVAEHTGADVTIRMRQSLARRVLVRAGGEAIAGVSVELLDRGGQVVRLATERRALGDADNLGSESARLVQRTVTDELGYATLLGPTGPLALLLRGDGVAHEIVQPVRLDEPGDLVLDVARAAKVCGRLVPESVMRDLWQSQQLRPNEVHKPFGIQLSSPEHGEFQIAYAKPFAVDEHGLFEIDGLPAGTWRIRVLAGCTFAFADVVLTEGEVLDREFDISALAPAIVKLSVTVNGDPVTDGLVMLMGKHAVDVTTRRFTSSQLLPIDGLETLRVTTWPGDFEVHVLRQNLTLRTTAQVGASAEQTINIDVRTGSLELQLLDNSGEIVAEMPVRLRTDAWLGRTDAAGRLRVDVIVAGTYVPQVLPLHLRTEQQRNEYGIQNGWQGLEPQWLSLPEIVVMPGTVATLRLTMPASENR